MNRLSETYQQHITVLPVTLKTVDPVYDKAHVTINRSAISTSSYVSYGMEMPGRTFTAQSYRYAYQGSEQAPEYSQAGGNVYTTFFRTLDSRLGRWSTPDVVSQPWQSPYCSMDNNPVALVDPWGAESGSEPGFESGRGTNENPIQIEEITVTASRSGGTSSAPSRTKIYVNTFDPGDLVMNQIRKSQAQEDFENSAPEQNKQVNYRTNMWMSTQGLGAPKEKKLWQQKSGIHFTSPDATGDGPGVKAQDEESVHTADAEWVSALSYYTSNPNLFFEWLGKIFNWFTFPETTEKDNPDPETSNNKDHSSKQTVENNGAQPTPKVSDSEEKLENKIQENNRQVHGKEINYFIARTTHGTRWYYETTTGANQTNYGDTLKFIGEDYNSSDSIWIVPKEK